MQAEPGVVKGVADKAVKLGVLLLLDLFFAAFPEGLHRVDLFPLDENGERSKIGVLLDDLFDLVFIGKLVGIILQFDNDPGAAPQPLLRCQGIAAAAVRGPLVPFGVRPVGAGQDPHPFSRHEDGIKTDAELAY